MTIGELSERTEISAYTLRYYEKKGLIRVTRDEAGRRVFEDADEKWIQFIKRLKDTGMLLRDIKRYSELRYLGDSTIEQRLNMLVEHREYVLRERERWEEHLNRLDDKIVIYKCYGTK